MALSGQELANLAACVGPHRTVVASAIGELFLASPAAGILAGEYSEIAVQFPEIRTCKGEWVSTRVAGAVAFVVDREINTFLFQIFDLDGFVLRFQFEVYEDLDYLELEGHFHAFELDDCVAGLNFSDALAAKRFREKVLGLLPQSKPGDDKQISAGTYISSAGGRERGGSAAPGEPRRRSNATSGPTLGSPLRDALASSARPASASKPATPSRASAISSFFSLRATAKVRKSKKRGSANAIDDHAKMDSLIFADARARRPSEPVNFQMNPLVPREAAGAAALEEKGEYGQREGAGPKHISTARNVVHREHVGLNPDGSLDLTEIPAEWKHLFQKAGIKKKDLNDPHVKAQIRDAVASAGLKTRSRTITRTYSKNLREEDLAPPRRPSISRKFMAEQIRLQQQREQVHLEEESEPPVAVVQTASDSTKTSPPVPPPRRSRAPPPADEGLDDVDAREAEGNSAEGNSSHVDAEEPDRPVPSRLAVLREIEDRRARVRARGKSRSRTASGSSGAAAGALAQLAQSPIAPAVAKSEPASTPVAPRATAPTAVEPQARASNSEERKPQPGFLGDISQGQFRLRKVPAEAKETRKEQKSSRPAFLREIETGLVSLRRLSEVEALPELDTKNSGVQDSLLSILKTCVMERRDHVRQEEDESKSVRDDEWSDDGWD